MKNISHSEFSAVIQVLDDLMKQRRLNFLLKAWSKIKMENKKNRILFSNPSFAGKISQLDVLEVQERPARYNRPRHNTVGNERFIEQENNSFNKNDFSFSTSQKNFQFQDMVLERLKLMQTKLSYLQEKKFQKKRQQIGYQQIKKKPLTNLQKYNGSRHSLSSKQNVDTNSIIQQSQLQLYRVVDETSEKSSNEEINYVQTPKIGERAHQKKRKSFIFPQVYDALNMNNQTQGTQNMEEVSLDKNQLKYQSYSEFSNEYHSDRFHKKYKNQYQPSKGFHTYRNKNKKQDYMNGETYPKSTLTYPNIPYSKKKESSQKLLNYWNRNKMLI